MEVLVEFKNRLKEIQRWRRQNIKNNRIEYLKLKNLAEELFVTVPTKDLSYEELEREFPHYYSLFPRFEELVKCYEKHDTTVIKVCLLYKMVNRIIESLQKEIQNFQLIIEACDNDKVKNPIKDFDYLLMSLIDAEMRVEDSFLVFGMFCSCCSERLKSDFNYMKGQIQKSIFILGESYFNKDGTFKENKNSIQMLPFIDALADILNFNSLNNEMKIKLAFLAQSFLYLATHQKNSVRVEEKESHQKSPMVFDEHFNESTFELRKYYKNGELIEIPEDIEVFKKILDKCGIDENEKRYILGLVTEALEKQKSTKILKYLNANDKKTYQEAEELLKGI
ncbi:MAG: hypothetical protein E7161_05195, partial [Firmicutes bacterium]|nr:hypothetical protein [Bacillota bacterium]